jgi:hypothetical protein
MMSSNHSVLLRACAGVWSPGSTATADLNRRSKAVGGPGWGTGGRRPMGLRPRLNLLDAVGPALVAMASTVKRYNPVRLESELLSWWLSDRKRRQIAYMPRKLGTERAFIEAVFKRRYPRHVEVPWIPIQDVARSEAAGRGSRRRASSANRKSAGRSDTGRSDTGRSDTGRAAQWAHNGCAAMGRQWATARNPG